MNPHRDIIDEAILKVLRKNDMMMVPEIAEKTGYSLPTVTKHLLELVIQSRVTYIEVGRRGRAWKIKM